MTQCPQCFSPIGEVVAAYSCQGGCSDLIDSAYSDWFGRERRSKPLTMLYPPTDPKAARRWSPPDVASCRICKQRASRVCRTCHYVLPEGWLEAKVVCIALAGPRSTGKSVYLGVMVRKLADLVERLGSNLTPVGKTRSIYQDTYEKALFTARAMMEPTGAATTDSYQQEPMIFSFGRINNAPQQTFLVVRDVAGEDLENNHRKQYVQFYRNASMVLFHFDPTQIPEVKDELKGYVTDVNHVGGEPGAVLTHVLEILGDARPMLAVTLSKFDTLQLIGAGGSQLAGGTGHANATNWSKQLANPGAAFNRESGAELEYDPEDGELLHEEIRSVLAKLRAVGLINQLERPAKGGPMRHRFFATSALGEPPLYGKTNPRGIAPFRVLDPIKWALSEFKVIGTSRSGASR